MNTQYTDLGKDITNKLLLGTAALIGLEVTDEHKEAARAGLFSTVNVEGCTFIRHLTDEEQARVLYNAALKKVFGEYLMKNASDDEYIPQGLAWASMVGKCEAEAFWSEVRDSQPELNKPGTSLRIATDPDSGRLGIYMGEQQDNPLAALFAALGRG